MATSPDRMTPPSPDRSIILDRAAGVLWLGMALAAVVYAWN